MRPPDVPGRIRRGHTVCRELRIAWTVRDRDVVFTTPEAAQERLLAHVHDVSDLITDDVQLLIDTIQTSAAAPTWDTVGGPATAKFLDGDAPCLVVAHTTAGHRAVAAFLGSLR